MPISAQVTRTPARPADPEMAVQAQAEPHPEADERAPEHDDRERGRECHRHDADLKEEGSDGKHASAAGPVLEGG